MPITEVEVETLGPASIPQQRDQEFGINIRVGFLPAAIGAALSMADNKLADLLRR